MKLSKKELDEIIDSENELIGADSVPNSGSNLETQANNTTDNNVKISHQPFSFDMLSRFGFMVPFFEGEENKDTKNELLDELAKFMYDRYMDIIKHYYKNPQKLKQDYRKKSKSSFKNDDSNKIDYEYANEILDIIKPYLDKELKTLDETLKENIGESEFIEGKILDNRDIREINSEKDNRESEIFDKKIKKIAGLIDKMSPDNKNKIKKLLEDY